jgi:hypothetical protein
METSHIFCYFLILHIYTGHRSSRLFAVTLSFQKWAVKFKHDMINMTQEVALLGTTRTD